MVAVLLRPFMAALELADRVIQPCARIYQRDAVLVGHLSWVLPFGVRQGALSSGNAAHIDSVRRNGHHRDK